jgi:hypothetical protein
MTLEQIIILVLLIAFSAGVVIALFRQTWFHCPICAKYHSDDGVMRKERPNQLHIENAYCPTCHFDIHGEIDLNALRGQSAVSSLSSGLSGASRTRATDSANPAPAESRCHNVSEKSDQAAGGVNLGGTK